MSGIKRRTVLRSLLSSPVAAAALPALARGQELKAHPPAINDNPSTPTVQGSASCKTITTTFSDAQIAALRKLAGIMVPPMDDTPGAVEVGVPEFLDFLIGVSPAARGTLYKDGLDRLNSEAEKRYGKPFGQLSAEEADPILSPLHASWSYAGPSDPFARFLQAAKQDLMTGTVNSEDYILVASQRRRSAGGVGQYWHPIE